LLGGAWVAPLDRGQNVGDVVHRRYQDREMGPVRSVTARALVRQCREMPFPGSETREPARRKPSDPRRGLLRYLQPSAQGSDHLFAGRH
jgi:hypothetical protein